MKKIMIAIAAVMGLGSLFSCSDMLETESTQRIFDPSMDAKTDSMYYAFGVLQALQSVADQYYLQGEMRGDLVKVIPNVTDKNLQDLANFSATTTNKYDSAYQYYRVINNCNYYIAHRDTTLLTGSTPVVKNEYVAIKAIRAWAYLQLARNYGTVPFVTEPLTSISQIESTNFPMKDLAGIVEALAPDLAQYSGTPCPDHGNFDLGSTNWGTKIEIMSDLFYIPVDVILGDLYLENNDYPNAVKYYVNYLTQVATASQRFPYLAAQRSWNYSELPEDFGGYSLRGNSYAGVFSSSTAGATAVDNISCIQMPMNRLKGVTTVLPSIYGFDFYASNGNDVMKADYIQLKPSESYLELSDTTSYYYEKAGSSIGEISSAQLGDARYKSISTVQTENEDEEYIWLRKVAYARLYLYRTSTVWMHLAEALNRMGHPDLAFAILKDGLSDAVISEAVIRHDEIKDEIIGYITEESQKLMTETYPLLSSANVLNFPKENMVGIHAHGCGMVADYDGNNNYVPGFNTYQLGKIAGYKLNYLKNKFPEVAGKIDIDALAKNDNLSRVIEGKPLILENPETPDAPAAEINYTLSKADVINAVEDLLCDEYALEFAFEGTRYYDLMRLARHKNADPHYGANFGGIWLKDKLKDKNPQKDLSNTDNWYLPFK